MDPEIKESVRKLFRKFMLLHVVLLAAAVGLSILFTGYFKERLGRQLATASRDALLTGDARRVINIMPSSMSRDFSGMSWRPSGGEPGFSVPSEAEHSSLTLYSRARVRLFFDESGAVPLGEMLFYYPRWTPVLWGVLAWFAIFLASLPVALRERRRLIKDYNLLLELRVKESYGALAAQVAHDIRSPLAALDSALRDFSDLPGERRELARGAMGRIGEIARDLLDSYRTPGQAAPAKEEAVACDLKALAAPVLAEKRALYAGRRGVSIEFSAEDGARAAVCPAEFRRLVSNLVNNAVEAFEAGGRVDVSLSHADGKVVLTVADNGKGIPAEILARLGHRGETHGKSGGTGLGLYHARSSAESWGGSLEIDSKPGAGTAVRVVLPAIATAAAPKRAVLIDDDALVRINWKTSARSKGVDLAVFSSPAEFLSGAGGFPRDIPVYLDSSLGDGVKGEDIAVVLKEKGFADITLETGYDPARFAALGWLKVSGKEPPWA